MLPSDKDIEFQEQQTDLKNGGFIAKKRSATRRNTPQIIATLGFGMLIFGVSSICVMPTIVIGALYENNETEINISEQEASWFGSIVYIAQPLGSISSGFTQEVFGRKHCMMAVNIPQIIGWIILCFSNSVEQLYVAAVIMGLSIGFMEAPAMSYLGEVCEPRLRGILSSFSETFLLIGILFEFFVGAVLYWRYACAASVVIPISTFIILYFVPESPTWYVVKDRISDAEKALMWLRGWLTKEEIQQELNNLINDIKSQKQSVYVLVPTSECCAKNVINERRKVRVWDQVKLLNQPRVYRPLLLVALFFFIGHCVTVLGMRPFLVKIFTDLNLSFQPYTVLVITGACQAVGSIFCVLLIHLLGKRILVFSTMIMCCLGLLGLAIYIMLSANYPWIPLIMFGLIFFGGGMGVMTIPWVLISEIFPLDARGISAGLAAASSYVFAFIVTKTYVDLVYLMGITGVLFLYFGIGLLGLVYLYFNLPETEGKTLTQIEDLFKTKCK